MLFTPPMIVELRKKLGLSVIEFAKAMGVHRQTVYEWQRGETHPTFAKLEEMNQLAERAKLVKVG